MFRSAPTFDKLLDKATSHLHLDPDWPTILQICDTIRAGDIQPKTALAQIKKKITNQNPHVAFFGLLVLESCVKNCGALIHDEIGTKQYMEQLKELVKTTTHENVKAKTLELIQAWAFAFRNSPKYTAVKDTISIMKAEGYIFPPLKESDAMFSADTAPEWADGEVCHRCRVTFGVMQRKHHCRACGQVFCGQCSNKTSTLPKYGIEKPVRVCDACFEHVNRPSSANSKESDLPVEYLSSSLAQQQQVPPRKSTAELQEEEELQLALALSQSEAEEKEKEKKRMTNSYKNHTPPVKTYSPPPSPGPSPSKLQEDEAVDSELVKYLNRQYWEDRSSKIEDLPSIRQDVTSPSAPNISSPMPQRVVIGKQQNGEVDIKMDEFVSDLRSQVEIFVNRMKSNSSRGRPISNDSLSQDLFMNIPTKHSRLLKYIQEHDDTRVGYEGLQDKLTQVKDARAALDALREEHKDRLRREAEEIERMKQLQMAQKLDIMRKKKQEYLQYQRELALQKIQERERELQMRQEQQKQQYIMGNYQPVGNYMGQSQGSPIRHMHYTPGSTYPMSPTSQGIYTYGPPPMGNYPMPGMPGMPYGMPQMPSNHIPPHMMSNIPGNQSDQPQGLPQQSGPGSGPGSEGVIPSREGMPPPGMMPQMANVPPMPQIPGHQMSLPQAQGMPGVHPGVGHTQAINQIPQIPGNQAAMRPPGPMGMSQVGPTIPQHPPGPAGPPGAVISQQMSIPSQPPQQIPYQQPVEQSTTTETVPKAEDHSAEPLISFD
ncbi:hepatocyte growth factor-regulated tyrosine kinase substrate [Fopius arisanus]|uniref:Hepatocyte growth factor-regulated tyrosine kinase substrate n=1 Tax=Fopius arisanus TaxID=64838 RepID=A0A9R1TDL6_9HYME|nr:PREDICTED: hepatocyte growth factor-regulated tyrosine kinase substrate [Fopius arisanus]